MNQEFAETIKTHIREYLPVDYQDAKITLEKVTKGNDRTLTGLIIRKDDETVTPSIYLEHYEEQFGKGRSMDDIMKEIAQIKMENSLEVPIDVKGLQDYETASYAVFFISKNGGYGNEVSNCGKALCCHVAGGGSGRE